MSRNPWSARTTWPTLRMSVPSIYMSVLVFECVDVDSLAERLRRRPAKPMGSPRVGSNPTGVVSLLCIVSLPAHAHAQYRLFAHLGSRLVDTMVSSCGGCSLGLRQQQHCGSLRPRMRAAFAQLPRLPVPAKSHPNHVYRCERRTLRDELQLSATCVPRYCLHLIWNPRQ